MIEVFILNENLFFWINGFANKNYYLDLFFIFLAEPLVYIMSAYALWFFGKKIWADKVIEIKEFFIYFSAIIFSWLSAKIIKLLVVAERPFSFFDMQTLLSHKNIFSSFPSGHSTVAFALATSVYIYNKKIGTIFFILAFMVALGRIFVGVHYPLDVFVGGIIGIIFPFLISKFINYKK